MTSPQTPRPNLRHLSLVALFSATLSACGGGDDASPAASTPAAPPAAATPATPPATLPAAAITYNECQAPNSAITGTYTQHLEYAITSSFSSATVIDTSTVNNAPAAFNGSGSYANSTTNITNTNVISAFGISQTAAQISKFTAFTTLVGGLQALVGGITEVNSSGVTVKSSTAYNPFYVSRMFTLAIGEEITDQQSGTTTTTLPTPSTTNYSNTSRYKYVSRQTITVLGKSYDTCKYESQATAPTLGETVTDWFVVGKGVMVRQTIGGAAPSTTELKSGTINGAPV